MIAPIELAYLPQGDQMALLDWLGYHAQLHHVIGEKAVRDGHTDLGTYPISTMADRDDWLYFHQQEHIQISETYNLPAPPDLTYWDENDPTNFNNWLQSHALVHDGEKKNLGL
jgi:hypothetical protein